jgi:hypothetical protein
MQYHNKTFFHCRYTVKKVSNFPIASRDVTDQTLPDREFKLFPERESLVSDNPGPAGDGKITNLLKRGVRLSGG